VDFVYARFGVAFFESTPYASAWALRLRHTIIWVYLGANWLGETPAGAFPVRLTEKFSICEGKFGWVKIGRFGIDLSGIHAE
jgi:hypothetical protein